MRSLLRRYSLVMSHVNPSSSTGRARHEHCRVCCVMVPPVMIICTRSLSCKVLWIKVTYALHYNDTFSLHVNMYPFFYLKIDTSFVKFLILIIVYDHITMCICSSSWWWSWNATHSMQLIAYHEYHAYHPWYKDAWGDVWIARICIYWNN